METLVESKSESGNWTSSSSTLGEANLKKEGSLGRRRPLLPDIRPLMFVADALLGETIEVVAITMVARDRRDKFLFVRESK